MKKNFIVAVLLIVGIATAITISSSKMDKPIWENHGIKVTPMEGSPDYPNAELSLTSPSGKTALTAGMDTFKFDVKNFQLGMQTPDAAQKMCANSAKGQHIHFIMDNAPYIASYSPTIAADVKPGHHVLLAFLSRSYHESLKHSNSYILKEFNVGDNNAQDNFNEKGAHLFYSRPKAEYVGEQETKRVMLDFYLVNCTLSKDGYKVRATVNGNEFLLTTWKPYMIEGLPMGESKIKLELLDASNKLVVSPFNGVERTITLKPDVGKN